VGGRDDNIVQAGCNLLVNTIRMVYRSGRLWQEIVRGGGEGGTAGGRNGGRTPNMERRRELR
jgi:hypothetical protein